MTANPERPVFVFDERGFLRATPEQIADHLNPAPEES
jgi:hypothetical protein